jgi:hypothetical protein
MALDARSRIVVVGITTDRSGLGFVVARYTRDGVLDPSFGSHGVRKVAIGVDDNQGHAVLIQRDGKIVAAGEAFNHFKHRTDFALVRLLDVQVICRVPAVRGRLLGWAKHALARAHCSLGRVLRVSSKRVHSARVISQHPSPGVRLPPGGRVRLVVSAGKR